MLGRPAGRPARRRASSASASGCSSTSRCCRRSASRRWSSSSSATSPGACARRATRRRRCVPLAAGAARHARRRGRLLVIQFLLGVERAGQPASSCARSSATVAHQHAARAARLRARAPLARAVAARRAAPPPPPRVRAPRPRSARSSQRMIQLARGPPPADQPAARAARRHARRDRARAVRDRLLPPVVPAGALRRPVPRRRPTTTRSREVRIQAPRGEIVDRNGAGSSTTARRTSSRSSRGLPEGVPRRDWGQRCRRLSGRRARASRPVPPIAAELRDATAPGRVLACASAIQRERRAARRCRTRRHRQAPTSRARS